MIDSPATEVRTNRILLTSNVALSFSLKKTFFDNSLPSLYWPFEDFCKLEKIELCRDHQLSSGLRSSHSRFRGQRFNLDMWLINFYTLIYIELEF